IDRLMQSQFRYQPAEKAVEEGDKVCMDYTGYIGDEPFDGGNAENAELVIGSGSYIPGFEAQLIGAKAGDNIKVEVQFPANYHVEALAGQAACFNVVLKTVMKGTACDAVDDLASLLGFADEAALRADSKDRLGLEANKATLEKTRDSIEKALLQANPISVPDRILQEHVAEAVKHYEKRRMEEGGAALSDEEQARFVEHATAVENIKLQISMVFQAIRTEADLTVSDDDILTELNTMAKEHPKEQRDAYIDWMQSNKENKERVESAVLERKCVAYVLAHSKVTTVVKTITELQKELDVETSEAAAQA
ncbi:MAG: trigger factor, partial [Mariprofundaceae bacterium]|nr:trigger factor [Mariprofundaceae bacterium]